ncbi:MAG TPA: tetratricopeptide repeat protein, partial [Bacteroidales bacterium]|jgi:tetratricopeptide (TPR) repeat protein|nr:tetratricopeptide repeat protein [Bacteroidales bacterium]
MLKAIETDPDNPIWYAELEKYCDFAQKDPASCIAVFEKNQGIVKQNTTAPQSLVKLYNVAGEFDKAIELLNTHHFRTWEGGRSIYWHYVDAHVMKAIQLSETGQYKEAINHLEQALLYPGNLEVGKGLHDERNAMILYYMGTIYEAAGNKKKATESFRKSSTAVNSHDWPDLLYYQALSYRKFGNNEKAEEFLNSLSETGKSNIESGNKIPSSGAIYDLTDRRDMISEGYYLQALSELARENKEKARELFLKSVETYRNNLWARHYLKNMK